jgi:hypothetical protein
MSHQLTKNQRSSSLLRENLRLAKNRYPLGLSVACLFQLRHLTETWSLSLKLGDFQLLEQGWYVTHSGLLRLAHRDGCFGLNVQPVYRLCDASAGRYAFRATVYRSIRCKGFVGYGDADPSNVSSVVRGAEMRIAETRAVNRALRKAYGIGHCSVEEVGSFPRGAEPSPEPGKHPPQSTNGNGNGSPRVRDRLCQLIRQHQLDPELVKAYATDAL